MKKAIDEIKEISYIAFPVMGAFLSHLLMDFTGNVMSGRYSSNDLAAVSIGSAIWVPTYLFFSSILSALTPLMATMIGEGSTIKLKDLLKTGKAIAIAIGIALIILFFGSGVLIDIIVKDPSISAIAKRYLFYIILGMPGFLIYQIYLSLFESYGKTVPIMISSFTGMIINIPLTYIFVYGKLGIPPLGGAGSGIAISITTYIVLTIAMVFSKKIINPGKGKIKFDLIKKIFYLGIPIGASTFLESFVFSFGSIMLASLGALTIAAHQIALNFISTIFMIPLSFGIAISVRVSQYYGKKDMPYTSYIWKVGLIYVEGIAILLSVLMLSYAHYILSFYTKDTEVLKIAYPLFVLSISFHVVDAFQVAANNILKGYHNTKLPMFVNIFSYWVIALPLGYFLTYIVKLNAMGFWLALIAGEINSAIVMGTYLIKNYNFNKK